MEYNFREIEEKWRNHWREKNVYRVNNPVAAQPAKPKFYVLDMFPYPSGAGLHVGHPLGYIASDIYSRFKRLKGFNVLHPMGFDSFGLPAEQYAIETGQHPATTTEKNISTFKAQLDKIGFCYDWEREVRTSDPSYYKWTQWIFLQLFNSYFCNTQKKARPIAELITKYEKQGSKNFTAGDWNAYTNKEQEDILMKRRLAFSAYGEVNWCEALGTVLANDEVVNGVSERGGFPVVKKKMRQWYLRITAYADRLLEGLEKVAFSESMKEMQRNWIGKSEGAEIEFRIQHSEFKIAVYTTRPDTIFGVDFLVLAPEHELVNSITTAEQRQRVDEYLAYVKSRSDRERMAEVKMITGCFTGAYVEHPFTGIKIPVWIAEYVLAGYGTGAIMAVPCGDQRDFTFAKHFDIPITNIIADKFDSKEANPTKEAMLENSGFLNGLVMKNAIAVAINKIEEEELGKRKINYRMRDAGFSRQRYWGEPFPIIWHDGIAIPLNENQLPLELPFVEKYGPGPEGEGPLANIREWASSPTLLHGMEKGEAKIDAKNVVKGAALVPKYRVSTPLQYEFAKRMRKEYTAAEDLLWQQLRANKTGVKFRRQHPVESYIADFACLQVALIIEVDGGYHESGEQKTYDETRTESLNEIGFTIIRFSNDEVLNNLNTVISKIKEQLQLLHSQPSESHDQSNEFKHPSSPAEQGSGARETSTMPGYAGSSWYFLRYMDPHNNQTFCDRSASNYWNQVDVYIGGTEHAVGHLLYSRMWTKVLYDLNLIGFDEPFKKLVNQGMITGVSEFIKELRFEKEMAKESEKVERQITFSVKDINIEINVSRGDGHNHIFISKDVAFDFKLFVLNEKSSVFKRVGHEFSEHRAKIKFINQTPEKSILNIEEWISNEPEYKDSLLICKDGYWTRGQYFDFSGKNIFTRLEFLTRPVNEKMSKSKLNSVNPDDLVNKYGADTFRMYEMFLGPVEASKPWDTKGIEGVHRFLKKLWRLFFDELKGKIWTNEKANEPDLKVLHRTIKKIESDTENFSFNTAVSAFMISVNDLLDLKCYKKEILEQLLVLLVPYAPHIAEELWHQLGNEGTILDAAYPVLEEKYLAESAKDYPISINGKMRTTISIDLNALQPEVETIVLQNDIVQKWLEGKSPKKIIFVKGKMVNLVI